MKRFISLALVLGLALSLAACGQPQSAESSAASSQEQSASSASSEQPTAASSDDPYANLAPVTLIYGNGAANGAAGDIWGNYFCENVAAITGGKLTIDYFGNSQLGVDSELQQQMLAGDIDIVSCQPAQTTSFVPEVAVFDLPMAFAKYNAATIDKALNDSSFTTLINEGYGKAGMICLGFLQGATFREMTSNKEIRSIADFNGVKIRTMDSKYHLMFWKALGANPTPLAFTELYMSLQQGVVEAQENATDTCVNSQFFEVQDYLVNTHHILYMNQFLMNKAKFESLDPAYQDAIRQAVAQATAKLAPDMQKINDDNKAVMIEKGMTSIEFEPSFIDEVITKADEVYVAIRAEIGDSIVDALINELKAAS